MKIKFNLRGTKEHGKIYIRCCNEGLDFSLPTELILNHTEWDQKKQSSKDEVFNLKLQELKVAILTSFNLDYSNGINIDKEWLKRVVFKHFNRDFQQESKLDDKVSIYLTNFCDYWIETEADKWKVSARKFMSDGLKNQYKRFVAILKEYEKSSGKIKLSEVTQDLMYSFVDYLEEENYNASTINRHIIRLKFFCNRALEMNFNVNKAFNSRVFVEKDKEKDDVYLNESEIQKILELDLSNNELLNNVRDYFIIGLYSGMRLGDLLENLNVDHIQGDFIEIKTQKTGSNVVIPIHNEIKKVISRNFGFLPPRINRDTYNRNIKILCQLAEIDEMVYGSLFDKEKLRKVYGYFKKYELISSHIARKSFSTIYYNKLPNDVICSVLGWSSTAMLEHYNKETKKDKAKILSKYWNDEETN